MYNVYQRHHDIVHAVHVFTRGAHYLELPYSLNLACPRQAGCSVCVGVCVLVYYHMSM